MRTPLGSLLLLGAFGVALSCTGGEAPPPVEDCANDIDDDDDALADCRDSDCTGDIACTENCVNFQDDDFDGLTDCQDPDCAGELACVEVCDNGQDDDFDTQIDCGDPDCVAAAECEVCEPVAGQDSCTGNDICVGEDCVPAFGRQYQFSNLSVSLSTDVSWDTFGNAPDPRVQIFIDGGALLETGEAGNTFDANYNETATATLNGTTVIRLVVLDGDIDSDDVAITCEGSFSAEVLRARDVFCGNVQATLTLSVNPL